MTLHILGALLIAGASLTTGLSYVAGEHKKLNNLSSLLQMLREMRGELESRASPLPQLMERLSRSSGGAAGDFARELCSRIGELGEKEFSRIWSESLSAAIPALDRADAEPLHALGRSLGRYELSRQLAELDSCICTLESRVSACSAGLPEKRRMGLGLACSLGALLLIVLI